MTSTELAKTLAGRVRSRAQMLAAERRPSAVRDQVGASLERRIESVRRAARGAGGVGHSRIGTQLPKI